MSDNIKLSIEDMNLFYGNFHALKDINMHIPEKEITGDAHGRSQRKKPKSCQRSI